MNRRDLLANAGAVAGYLTLRPPTAAGPASAGSGTYRLANGFVELTGSSGDIASLRFDPSGHGRYGPSPITRLGIGPATGSLNAQLTWSSTGRTLVLEEIKVPIITEIQQTQQDSAPRVEPGHTLGQSFTVTKQYVSKVGAFAATYTTSDSGVTLRLRKDGPAGEIVFAQAFQNMTDNAWVYIDFDPQPAGVYYLEMADPVDSPAWWSSTTAQFADGRAYVDGSAVSGARTLDIVQFDTQQARWTFSLAGPALRSSCEPLTGSVNQLPAAEIVTNWTAAGYGVTATDGVPFSRFMSDTGQYISAHVLKRRSSAGPALGVNQWAYLTGTGNYDLRITAPNSTVAQIMSSDAMTLTVGGADGILGLTVMPHSDQVPEVMPQIETGDRTFDQRANEFLWNFTFVWSAGGFSATWFDWVAMGRMWTATDLARGLETTIAGFPVDPDGYVWSWGDSRYWPLDDPNKYDTRHFDNNARYILGAWRYFSWTGNENFLSNMLPKLRSAMDYQLTTLNGNEGLLRLDMPWHGGRPSDYASNYWDDLPFGYLDGYDNIYFYASLGAMADIEDHVGQSQRADELRALAAATRRSYNETFWDDKAGRYVTTIDSDGVRWDRGCTFLNIEAAAYGVADQGQVGRMYEWMEQQPTSSGDADTFSRYLFAPRVNTIDMGEWWYLDGKGAIPRQPYGTHLENGGAILYTTGFDVIARAAYLGADNAYRRLSAVLGRFAEPDHLSGGPPLYHGENTGWEVGTDIPFPEAGVAGACAVYAFLGLEAHPNQLVIAPNLPTTWDHLTVRNIGYHGKALTVTATHNHVRIDDGAHVHDTRYQRGQRIAIPATR